MTATLTPQSSEEQNAPARRLEPDAGLASEVHHSVRNAMKLGVSLVGTWAIALGLRVYLPRSLGPAAFGEYQFADAFTATVFVLLNLGLETYIRKEIPTRPAHAGEFFGATVFMRLAMGAALLAVAVAIAAISGKSGTVMLLVGILGVFQILFYFNGTYAAMLHATATVDGLSVLNVVAKVAWGVGIVVALTTGRGIVGVGVAMLFAEMLRLVGLVRLTRRHLGLRFRIDLVATRAVLWASLPFNVLLLANMAYAKLDVTVMSFLTTDKEVGWYGVASTIAGIALLLSPLIQWVVTPLSSRALARSEDALIAVVRRGLEVVLTIAIPSSLALGLGAADIVRVAFGPAYAPAVHSMQLLAPLFVVTYAGMLAATILVRLERGWTLTWILIGGMIASPIMNVILIPRCLAAFGPGGAGIGAALTLNTCELCTVSIMFLAIGRRSVDRRLLAMIAKTALVVSAVIVLDHVLRPLGLWRFLADATAYVALVIGSGAINAQEAAEFFRGVLQRSPSGAAATETVET